MAFIFRSNIRKVFNSSIRSTLSGIRVPQKQYLQYRNAANWKVDPGDDVETIMLKVENNVRKIGRIAKKDIESAILKIEYKKNISSTHALMLIRACGHFLIDEKSTDRMELFEKIHTMIQKLGAKLDVSHYNAILKVYLENDYEFDPNEFFNVMLKNNIEPNEITYARLIKKHALIKDMDGATSLLKHMKNENIQVNLDVFHALIIGYSRCDNMEKAENILNILREARIQPTTETFVCLITEFLLHQNIKKAKEYLKNAKIQGYIFDEKDNFELILALVKFGYDNEIDEVLNSMSKTSTFHRDAKNFIIKLVMMNKVDVAYKILLCTRQNNKFDGTLLPLGEYFIVQLVKSRITPDIIIDCCTKLSKSGLNPHAFTIAIEQSLRNGLNDMFFALCKAAQGNGCPIRYHYFWPLIVNSIKSKNFTEMLNILQKMNNDYDIGINTEILREIIVPNMIKTGQEPGTILSQLKSAGATVSATMSSIIITLLSDGRFEEAVKLVERYTCNFTMYYIRNPLLHSFSLTKDVDLYARFLAGLARGIQIHNERNDNTRVTGKTYRDFTGEMVILGLRRLADTPDFSKKAEELLKKLVANEVGISNGSAVQVENILQQALTDSMKETLKELVSSRYEHPPPKKLRSLLPAVNMNSKVLEKIYENTKTDNSADNLNMIKYLFTTYTNEKNEEKALEMRKNLENMNCRLNAGLYIRLLNMYVEMEDEVKAVNVYNELVDNIRNLSVDTTKMLKFIHLLIKKGDICRAYDILKITTNTRDNLEHNEKNTFSVPLLCRKILELFVQRDDLENLLKFRNLLLKNNLVQFNTMTMGSTIKLLTKRGDYNAALEEYENCVTEYKLSPWGNELMRYYVEQEDAVNLQRVLELQSSVFGESIALHNVLFCFLERGRLVDAEKIMQSPSMRLNTERFMNHAFKYYTNGEDAHLENLIKLTKNYDFVDRSVLYLMLLKTYDKINNAEKGLRLRESMEEEDMFPTDEFLITLAKLLERNGYPVAFNVPQQGETTKFTTDEFGQVRITEAKLALHKAILDKDIDQGIDCLKRYEKCYAIEEWTMLIEACMQNDRYDDAKKLFNEFYEKHKNIPLYKVSKFVFSGAMKQGDFQFLEKYSSILSDNLRKRLSVNNHICRAYLNAGSDHVEKYLKELVNKAENIKTQEDVEAFMNIYPRGGIISIMMDKPALVPQCESLLRKVISMKCKQSIEFANTLWTYYMSTKNFKQAEDIWVQHLKNTDERLDFRKLTSQSYAEGDDVLAMKVIECAEQNKFIKPELMGAVYSSGISALVQQNKIHEALDVLKRSMKRIKFHHIGKEIQLTLKLACEARNIPFPNLEDS